jgi:hypothetical protein
MVERGDRTRLAFEPLAEIGADDLDGDGPPEPRVARPVDLAHTAFAQLGDDFIGAEAGAGGQHVGPEDYRSSS